MIDVTGQNLVHEALEIAKLAHTEQFRHDKKTPYIMHPKEVAGKFESSFLKAIALLHDVIEDSVWTFEDLRKEGIPRKVCEAVEVLTRYKDEDYLEYILSVKNNYYAKLVKIEDMKHNMKTSTGKQKIKYQLSLHILEKE